MQKPITTGNVAKSKNVESTGRLLVKKYYLNRLDQLCIEFTNRNGDLVSLALDPVAMPVITKKEGG